MEKKWLPPPKKKKLAGIKFVLLCKRRHPDYI